MYQSRICHGIVANGWARSPPVEPITSTFLVGAGLVAAVTYLFVTVTELQLVDATFAGGYLELMMLGVPAVGLLYAGYWLHVGDFDSSRIRRIGRFGVAGAVLGSAATAVVLLLGAVPTLDGSATFVLFVATGTEGSLLGVLVGAFAATDARYRGERTDAAELEVLHELLRHNVRNRLMIIGGNLALLTEEDAAPDADAMSTIEAQLEAIESLLEDTRLAAEAVGSTTVEPVDLVRIVRDQLALLEASYDEVTVSSDLPERAVVAGGDLLAGVVENVLTNAVAHHDQPTAVLTVTASVSGGDVRLEIADDGPGIPAHRREAVFEAGTGEGSGMGLYLARTVVERYGGTVELDDNDPRGTVVTITLPRAAG